MKFAYVKNACFCCCLILKLKTVGKSEWQIKLKYLAYAVLY